MDDGFEDCYNNAWPIMRKYKVACTVFIVTEKIGGVNDWDGIERGKLRLMNSTQIRQMTEDGIQFQPHSTAHRHLLSTNHKELDYEIRQSMVQLQSITGNKPKCFAYPYGEYNANIRRIVINAGYEAACTTWPGLNYQSTDLFQLKRINVSGQDSLTDFKAKLKFGFSVLTPSNLRVAAGQLLRRLKLLPRQEV
jgi:peptidoglycan/xylan/chitin deacetylase (PgdA/CDA1 family)